MIRLHYRCGFDGRERAGQGSRGHDQDQEIAYVAEEAPIIERGYISLTTERRSESPSTTTINHRWLGIQDRVRTGVGLQ